MQTTMTIGTNTWYPPWGGCDPWKNGYANAIDPERVGDPDYNPWDPVFLEEMRGYAVIRMMDFGKINWDTVEVHWQDRVRKEERNQHRMALYWMVDLCNRVKRDLWICLPERSAPDYWEGAARLIHQHLDPKLKVYVEWTNESWLPMFSALQTAIDSGKVYDLWFPGDRDKPWGEKRLAARYTVFVAERIWKTFAREFGEESRHRLVRVLSGAAPDNWWNAALINALGDPKINPDGIMPDAFAIAPYVGHKLDGADPDIVQKMNEVMAGVERDIQELVALLNGKGRWSAEMPAPQEAKDIPIICYEMGQHILKNAKAFARNPRAYDWYMGYLDMLSRYVRGVACHYTHASPWGDMAWGAKSHPGQAVAEAPKFRALWNWSVLHRPDPGKPHKLTVEQGEGSGEYVRDFYALIRANRGGKGFLRWEGDTEWVENPQAAVTVVRMPDRDVAVRAVYR